MSWRRFLRRKHWDAERKLEIEAYLETGRNFGLNDTGTSARVAVVNQTFVHRYLGEANPIGQTLRTHAEPGYPSTVYQIVGTIADTKYDSLRGNTSPMAFAPATQFPADGPSAAIIINFNLSAATAAESVRRRIASKHPEVIVGCGSFEARIRDGLVRERMMAMLAGFFGLLAAVGLYGVISYVVTRRRNEIGIRIALGAARRQIVGMVMMEAGVLLAFGVAVLLALAAGRSASSLLFELKPYDPLTLGAAVGLMVAIGSVRCD